MHDEAAWSGYPPGWGDELPLPPPKEGLWWWALTFLAGWGAFTGPAMFVLSWADRHRTPDLRGAVLYAFSMVGLSVAIISVRSVRWLHGHEGRSAAQALVGWWQVEARTDRAPKS